MKKNVYKESDADHTLFVKHKVNNVTSLIMYVDDMVVIGNIPNEITSLQKILEA